MFQEIYVIDEQEKLTEELKKIFDKHQNLKFKTISTNDLDKVLSNPPQLIIINDDNIKMKTVELCKKIRTNEENNIIPIIVVSSNEEQEFKMELAKNYVEYYIAKSMGTEYLYYRIRNIFRLLVINRTISPLTGLPGNVQIQTELKKRLQRRDDFVVLYIDLDNFKAYNDVYGFIKGGEIIKYTSKIVLKNINKLEKSDVFFGHIGGDDFVVILGKNVQYEEICKRIISEFDAGAKQFFTDEDLDRGYLKIQNRKGKMEHFPITSISIGIVIAEKGRFSNILEIGEVGAQVKHMAKSIMGSSYAIDRRQA